VVEALDRRTADARDAQAALRLVLAVGRVPREIPVRVALEA
jgi:hypothetical protein